MELIRYHLHCPEQWNESVAAYKRPAATKSYEFKLDLISGQKWDFHETFGRKNRLWKCSWNAAIGHDALLKTSRRCSNPCSKGFRSNETEGLLIRHNKIRTPCCAFIQDHHNRRPHSMEKGADTFCQASWIDWPDNTPSRNFQKRVAVTIRCHSKNENKIETVSPHPFWWPRLLQ